MRLFNIDFLSRMYNIDKKIIFKAVSSHALTTVQNNGTTMVLDDGKLQSFLKNYDSSNLPMNQNKQVACVSDIDIYLDKNDNTYYCHVDGTYLYSKEYNNLLWELRNHLSSQIRLKNAGTHVYLNEEDIVYLLGLLMPQDIALKIKLKKYLKNIREKSLSKEK